jgi:hypothetical protein
MRKFVAISRGLCVLIGSDRGPTCCSAVFGTPRQTATVPPLPLRLIPRRLTSSRSGTPNSPRMSSATGVVPRPRSQRSKGLWYVATGNASQTAARDCIKQPEIMASRNC